MKAKDLMIEDWVAVHRPGDRHEQVRVKSVICNGTIEAKTSDGLVAIGELAVEPIPLTAEIRDMVSCHPKMAIYWDDRKTEQTGENWYEVRIHNGDESVLTLQLRYVHELQHALRLLGVENDICIKL